MNIDLDQVPPELRQHMTEELVRMNNFPLFDGNVEHFYSKVAVSKTRICPRCKGPTERKCAHFIYATDSYPRVMLAPARYFCGNCPTVIVDERMLVGGVKAGVRFRGVLGIQVEGKKEPCLFRTVNGRRPVYILDEDERMVSLSTMPMKSAPGNQGATDHSAGQEKR